MDAFIVVPFVGMLTMRNVAWTSLRVAPLDASAILVP